MRGKNHGGNHHGDMIVYRIDKEIIMDLHGIIEIIIPISGIIEVMATRGSK